MDGSGWNSQRVAAIVRLAVALACAVAGGFGLAIDADSAYTAVMCVVTAVAVVVAWWKNNNVTKASQVAQGYLDEIKRGEGE